jgi:hypothetical protein
MGKLKLLWNYFRSSLPKEFFEPTMLRNKQFSDFYSQLSGIYQSYSEHRPKNFELTYQPDLDWIYGKSSKEKKKNS